jgi:hypothetical protein
MLSILGIVGVIVATVQVFKTARDTGRNAAVWAVVTLVAGLGIQIVLPIFIGLVFAVVWLAAGATELEAQRAIQGPATIIGIACLFLSFLALWLIMRIVSRVPEGQSFNAPPGPPSIFNR